MGELVFKTQEELIVESIEEVCARMVNIRISKQH